jgi:hypothetical protein
MTSSRERAVWTAVYAVAVLLIASPLLELLGAVLPVRPSEVSWRFGTFGLLANSSVTPILGLATALAAGVTLDHSRFVRLLAIAEIALALLVILGLALFALDFLQLRHAVTAQARASYDGGSLRAAVNAALAAATLAVLGAAGLRATARGAGRAQPGRGGPPPLVVQVRPDEGD